jgi:hypothetical protein
MAEKYWNESFVFHVVQPNQTLVPIHSCRIQMGMTLQANFFLIPAFFRIL